MIYFARKHDCEACALKPSAAQTRLHARSPAPFTKLRIPTQSGRGFRFDVGHRSDLIPATIPR